MLRFAVALFSLFVAGSGTFADSNAVLTVTVENVSSRGGDLRIALYDRAHWDTDRDETVKDAVVPAVAPSTVVEFQDLKPGVYGLKMFQDFNHNRKFDFISLALPREKYGFSNDAPAIFGEPSFDRTKFTLRPGANAMTVHLR